MANVATYTNSVGVNLTGTTSPVVPRSEISATGNITGGNLRTTGNINSSNIIATSNVRAGNLTANGIISASTITATGTITGGNLTVGAVSGFVSASTLYATNNVTTAGLVSATGNVTGGNITTVGQVTATGNITGNYFVGNGSQLTGVSGSANAATLTGTGLSNNVIYSQLTSVGILLQLTVAGTLTVSGGKNVVVSNVQRNITVSNSAPSGGNVGDIWYQTL